MAKHEKAEYQILIDNASHFIESHAASANLDILPPVWDEGDSGIKITAHNLRIATADAEVDLAVPHEWLSRSSEGHNRFRTEVEAALARLKRHGSRH
jgi:hypothetical protein